ncbi:heme/hemin ABC transporter substrate-binding protein [Paracoccus ravus]|uniref:heme/hemin ABC transporter substrate-binding protein n=1 Tax=Paracoccus ravus TaxID=2447760 RepID=UPI00106DE9A3|nr:ABC transporter substrate-binding protein [Paracoccus ravus]
MKQLALVAICLAAPLHAESHPDASRVLAIGGSVTEIVYALGEQDRLVGRDTTSNWPPEASALTDIGYMRALSPEGVLSVSPDLILAEEGAGPPEAVSVLKSAELPYVTIPEGYDMKGVLAKVDAVAEALGVPEQGRALQDRLAAELSQAETLAKAVETPRRVLFILSLQGGRVMAGGEDSSADGIIRLAGAQNALGGMQGYKQITDEAVIEAAPDVILMMRRGDAKADAAANGGADDVAVIEAARAVPAIAQTPAGRDGRIVVMDGLKLLGFGPRTGEAALELHKLVYEAR